jgi:spore coat protein U-like protein
MKLERILVFCALLIAGAPARAATATTTFGVSANIVPTCSVSAAALNFGAAIPNPISSNVDSTSTITATCSSGADYTIALNAGIQGGTVALRRMGAGANTLNYTMFTDAGRSSVWGDGTLGTSLFNSSGSGSAQAITVYGRIPSGQTAPSTGTYTDTVTVTITF